MYNCINVFEKLGANFLSYVFFYVLVKADLISNKLTGIHD